MFCPYCGQPTPNDALRFCRQCGFRLDGVSQLLASGGAPLMQQPAFFPTSESPRRKGMKAGAKLMLTSVVMLPFFFAFAVMGAKSPFPLIIPFTIFLAGAARLFYARLLEDDHPVLTTSFRPMSTVTPAPPAQHIVQPAPQATVPPRALFAAGTNTNELPQQSSVTEQTTGLLKR